MTNDKLGEPMPEDEFERARYALVEGSEERALSGDSLFGFNVPVAEPVPPPKYDRAVVEAKQRANDAILQRLAARQVGVNAGELLMTYVALVVERLFGDMDDQRRLELENAYADVAAKRLEATESAVTQALLTRDVPPGGGLIRPGGWS